MSLLAGKVRQEMRVERKEVEVEDILAEEAVWTVARRRGKGWYCRGQDFYGVAGGNSNDIGLMKIIGFSA